MHAHQKRRERWEFENQQHLEKSLQMSQHWLRKQVELIAALISFLLYLLYLLLYIGSRAVLSANRSLWSGQQEIDQRLADAEQHRLRLSSHCSTWLK